MSSVSVEGDVLKLSGRLDLTTLMGFRQELAARFPFDREITVNLEQLEIDGSAVLALLILMARQARKDGGSVTFTGVSDNLSAMAALSGLTELLGLESVV